MKKARKKPPAENVEKLIAQAKENLARTKRKPTLAERLRLRKGS